MALTFVPFAAFVLFVPYFRSANVTMYPSGSATVNSVMPYHCVMSGMTTGASPRTDSHSSSMPWT